MSAAIVIGCYCNYCDKQRSPGDVFNWAGGTRICARCLEWHYKALELFAGKVPKECQNCLKTVAELESMFPNGDTGLYVHQLDGIYQVLCPVCSDAIRPKQKDRYRGTAFGHAQGLY